MTGFGRGAVEKDGRMLVIELKSVNHRFLDLGMRLPRHVGFLEDTLRAVLSERLSRGHVDLFMNYRNARQDARKVELDLPLLQAYLKAAEEAAAATSLENDLTLSAALRLPDVSSIVQAEEDRAQVSHLALEALNLALDEIIQMRAAEGKRLCADISSRIGVIGAIIDEIAQRAPNVPAEYRDKLNERIKELANGVEIDQTRLATEVAMFADRCNVDEEIVRVGSHLKQFEELLGGGEPAGRKMDFLVQELNREFNTIGSKTGDAAITGAVLRAKGEIEKIREQVQNIE